MSARDELPRGVRVERFTPASAPVASAYRSEAARPGEAVLLCATPSPPVVFVTIVLVVLSLLIALLGVAGNQPSGLCAVVMSAVFGGLAGLGLRAQLRKSVRLELGARVRMGTLEVASEEVRELHVVEQPEPGDPNAFAIFVELRDGSRVRGAHRLRIDQAQYIVRLGRAALGLERAPAPRVRVGRTEERELADEPRRARTKAKR